MVKYFRVLGSFCYILRDREHLAKFDTKSDEGIFLGYSNTSQTYRVYNLRTNTIMESINVKVDPIVPPTLDIENVDLFSSPSKDNSDASVESDVFLESDTKSESSTDQDSCTLSIVHQTLMLLAPNGFTRTSPMSQEM
ncbi:hypothetical protein ACFX12_028115 [Malus domestica]